MSQNKWDSLNIKKKYCNKRDEYGCWTPTYSTPEESHRFKKRSQNKKIEDLIEEGLSDYEYERNFDLNDIVTESDDPDNDIWSRSLCSMEISNGLQCGKECNATYYGFDDNQYIQFHASNRKKRPRRKRRYKKKSKSKKSSPKSLKSSPYKSSPPTTNISDALQPKSTIS